MISAVVVLLAGVSVVLGGPSVTPGWAGLILLYATQLSDALLWIVRTHAEMEMSMNSVERCVEYSEVEQEPAAIVEGARPGDEWPEQGVVNMKDVSVRYAPDLPLVLKKLNFSTRAGEKIGVVGRTGAGKSTLSLAFFRIVPLDEGSIEIDGKDISKMGLFDLRSRLTIIPQDPVLFAGTLRSNLDPIGASEDAALWRALEKTHVLESLGASNGSSGGEDASEGGDAADGSASGSGGNGSSTAAAAATGNEITLDSPVTENFSQGQRQLICLARALLRDSRVVFLDEATASIDAQTDARIQSTIRGELAGATVFCIAHRLRTVADYDRILVLDHGEFVEFGTPEELMTGAAGAGHFRRMCEETGEFDELLAIARRAAAATQPAPITETVS
ncbi:hypothetical protein HK405_013179 [Cladochytrium tenue]|nr:hypothetical protein HK405_013179 [Cladochytrium tenue]